MNVSRNQSLFLLLISAIVFFFFVSFDFRYSFRHLVGRSVIIISRSVLQKPTNMSILFFFAKVIEEKKVCNKKLLLKLLKASNIALIV